MSPQELEFILKMRDEASAVLNKMGVALKKAADGAGGLGDESQNAAKGLGEIVKNAKAAVAAIGGVYASMRTLHASMAAWGRYELGMIGVVKTTDMAGRELDNFRKKFDALDRTMNGISTRELHALSETVGQLGVKGVDNITSMTEVLAKLSMTTDIVGSQGASSVSRILTLTGEGAKAVGEFGDALNYLGNNTAATESEILHMATAMAQAVSEFGMSSKNILAMSAGARQLGVNFELFGTASGRVLRSLRDGLANNTSGFRSFLQVTNMTREQFDQMLKDKPEEVLLKFASAYASLTSGGGSAGFLSQLGLNTDEIKRVFGAIGMQIEAVQEKLRLVQSPEMHGALDREAQKFLEAQDNQLAGLVKAWRTLHAIIGEALAPLTGPIIENIKNGFYWLADVIKNLPTGIKQVVALLITLGPVASGILVAFKSLKLLLGGTALWTTVANGVATLTKSLGSLRGALAIAQTLLKRFWPVLAIMTVEKGVDWVADWAERNFGNDTQSKMGVFARKLAAVRDFMKSDIGVLWGKGVIQSGPNAGKDYWTGEQRYKQNAEGEWVEHVAEPPKDWGDGIGQMLHDKVQREIKKAGPVTIPISDEDYEALKALNSRIGFLEDLSKKEQALQNIRERGERGLKALQSRNAHITQEELNRAQRYMDTQKKLLEDPIGFSLRDVEDEIEAAKAVTGEAKNQLAIKQRIRELVEEGYKEEEATARVTDAMRRSFSTQSKRAFDDQLRAARENLAIAQATTEADRQRLQIAHEIASFEREHKPLAASDRAELESVMLAEQQITAYRSLLSTLDPVDTATKQYADDQAVLNAALARGEITLDRYLQLMQALDRLSLSARDPFADQLKSINEQIQLAKISGDYKQADVRTQQVINQMADRNIILTSAQIEQLKEYNRQLQDIQNENSSGLVGWADSIGTLRDNLLGAAKDFGTSMSEAISGVLVGEGGDFQNKLRNLGRQLVNIGVNQIMKTAVRDMQNAMSVGSKGAWGWLAEKFGISKPAEVKQPDFLKDINTAQMSVTAANVVLSGAGLGVVGGTGSDITRALPAANQNRAVDAFSLVLKDQGGGGGLDALAKYAVGNANLKGVSDALSQRLSAMLAAAPKQVQDNLQIFSAYRSNERQAQIFQDAVAKYGSVDAARKWAAPPGSSNHNWGNAMDLRYGDDFTRQWMHQNAGQYGLQFPMGHEPWHIEPIADNGGRLRAGQMAMANAPQIDTTAVTSSITQVNQNLSQMGTNIQQVSSNAQVAASNFTSTGVNLQQAGSAAQQAGPQFDQAGNAIQQAGVKASSSSPQVVNLGQAAGSLPAPLADATGGLGGFAQGLMGLVQQLLGGLGGGGGGFGGILSSVFSLFLHDGGKVGPSAPKIDLSSHLGIPKFHSGSSKNGDEFLSLLQKGERVLTEKQDERTQRALSGLTAGAMSGGSGGGGVFAPVTNISVEGGSRGGEADQALASKISQEVEAMMDMKMQEFTSKQMLAGGMFNRSRFG